MCRPPSSVATASGDEMHFKEKQRQTPLNVVGDGVLQRRCAAEGHDGGGELDGNHGAVGLVEPHALHELPLAVIVKLSSDQTGKVAELKAAKRDIGPARDNADDRPVQRRLCRTGADLCEGNCEESMIQARINIATD